MAILRALSLLLVLLSVLVFVAPIQWIARRFGWPLQHWIQTGFCRLICRIIGIDVKTYGDLPEGLSRVMVVNHVSWTDIIAISSLHPAVFLAKSEVAKWPVLGLLAKLQGTIFVERTHRQRIPAVNSRLAEVLRNGQDVVLFPEGTTSEGDEILKFNTAHFSPVVELVSGADSANAITLAPVAIAYTRRGNDPLRERMDIGWYGDMTFLPHLWRLMNIGGMTCHVFFGERIDPAGACRKTLAKAAETSVRNLLRGRDDEKARDLSAA